MTYADALAYLDAHATYDTTGRIEHPTVERMQRIVAAMGDPQDAAPVIHLTGTNGKGSTSQIVTRLLVAHGLTVGTYTSPHLERLNERICRNGEPIGDEDLAEQIAAIADLEMITGVRPSYFEIMTAAAYRWFADIAVDVAVIEVGLLGRWDATNVANGRVAIVTNVGLDHLEFAGPTLADVAREKAGIIKPGATVVLGETDLDLAAIFRAEQPDATVHERELDFECIENQLALGGRLLDVRTPRATYSELFLPLHGRHQGDNAACALVAVEDFFDAALDPEIVQEAFHEVSWPGRFEVLGHQPLVIVDGAHNPPGADAIAQVMDEDFDPAGKRILVVGFLNGRDPGDMLGALQADTADLVVCCTPDSPRAMPASEVAVAATALGCDEVVVVPNVGKACDLALSRAGGDDAVLVTGSLYVVGEARPHLKLRLP